MLVARSGSDDASVLQAAFPYHRNVRKTRHGRLGCKNETSTCSSNWRFYTRYIGDNATVQALENLSDNLNNFKSRDVVLVLSILCRPNHTTESQAIELIARDASRGSYQVRKIQNYFMRLK